MTWTEVDELGRQCLIEYEGQLKVKGIKPYDPSEDVKDVSLQVKDRPETLKAGIEEVLETLKKLEDGFTMSEPGEWVPNKTDRIRTVSHNNLRITFRKEDSTGTAYIWILCWYYVP